MCIRDSVDVNWDVLISMKINKVLSATLNLSLIHIYMKSHWINRNRMNLKNKNQMKTRKTETRITAVPAITGKRGWVSVSYTHLDVYKRQTLVYDRLFLAFTNCASACANCAFVCAS